MSEQEYPGTEDFGIPEVMDEGDAASIFQMQENQQALQMHRAKLAPETHPDFDGIHCIDCDAKIPKERLNMKRIRCTHCQHILEVKGKMYAK